MAIILPLSWICVQNFRRRPYLAVGWFWYLITLIPIIGIIQVGSQARADRYTYVPLIGIFIMLGWGFEELAAYFRIHRRVVLVIAGSFIGLLLPLAVAQVFIWRDDATLWKHALSIHPNNPIALMNLSDVEMREERYSDAYQHLLNARDLAPNLERVHIKIGIALEKLGRNEEAIRYFQHLPPDRRPYFVDQRMGTMLTRMGRFDEAEPYVQKVIHLAPGTRSKGWDPVDILASRLDWAIILRSRKRFPEAAQVLEIVVTGNPTSVQALGVLGMTLFDMGRPEEGLSRLKAASQLSPRDPQLLYWTGGILISLRRFAEAQSVFEKLKEVDPTFSLLSRGMLELEKARKGAKPAPSEGKHLMEENGEASTAGLIGDTTQ